MITATISPITCCCAGARPALTTSHPKARHGEHLRASEFGNKGRLRGTVMVKAATIADALDAIRQHTRHFVFKSNNRDEVGLMKPL
ncbi:hypothetical protein [Salinisphaera dokdonensis]|uniref:hypothetical protein n=1 Tax=Salinisphaera dokdonensis TaxID=454598 RepID=UPI003341F5A7